MDDDYRTSPELMLELARRRYEVLKREENRHKWYADKLRDAMAAIHGAK